MSHFDELALSMSPLSLANGGDPLSGDSLSLGLEMIDDV
jgi:hypothetical protein